jgi:hypothetical protein
MKFRTVLAAILGLASGGWDYLTVDEHARRIALSLGMDAGMREHQRIPSAAFTSQFAAP